MKQKSILQEAGFAPQDSSTEAENSHKISKALKRRKSLTGFTLVELLVVIAIIGLLASVVMVSLNSTRAKARDTKRAATLRQLATALELYYNDNGSYPSSNGGWRGTCSGYGSYGTTGANGYIPNLAPTYVSVLPIDPRYNDGQLCFLYNSNGADYALLAHATMETVVGGDPSAAGNPQWMQQMDRVNYTQPTIAVYSSGGKNW